jgi:hypothetical protein
METNMEAALLGFGKLERLRLPRKLEMESGGLGTRLI